MTTTLPPVTTPFKLTRLLGYNSEGGKVTVEIEVSDRNGKGLELSICGNSWMKSGRDILCGGQMQDHILDEIVKFAPGVTREAVEELVTLWNRWHLNGMRAACEHQRAENWGHEQVEVVSYKLTREAYQTREQAKLKAERAAVAGQVAPLTDQERALLACKWYADIFTPPDADSPLSGCYEVSKRETKTTGWVRQDEHPQGVLSKPCPTCGYKYGSAWLHEELPGEVIERVKVLGTSTDRG